MEFRGRCRVPRSSSTRSQQQRRRRRNPPKPTTSVANVRKIDDASAGSSRTAAGSAEWPPPAWWRSRLANTARPTAATGMPAVPASMMPVPRSERQQGGGGRHGQPDEEADPSDVPGRRGSRPGVVRRQRADDRQALGAAVPPSMAAMGMRAASADREMPVCCSIASAAKQRQVDEQPREPARAAPTRRVDGLLGAGAHRRGESSDASSWTARSRRRK